MRVSLNWLRDYLELRPDVDVFAIAESLTLAGLEVEHIEHLLVKSKSITLAEIKSISQWDGNSARYELLCGHETITATSMLSSFITTGMMAAVIQERNMVRLATYGDLGLPLGAHEPIYFTKEMIDPEAKTLSDIKEFDDVIISLQVTPNRADALSHLGISRELCAALDVNARSFMLTPREMAGPIHEKVTVEIENSEDCPRYACRLLESVQVSESPYWLKLRLLGAGLRPINNVVDVVNYVMLSRGQPLHVYDYDKLHLGNLRAKISVKRAEDGEAFFGLDGKKLKLTSEDLVIFDGSIPLALAGIIGGEESAVTSQSKTILIESAYFDPKIVRMSARRHGIITESSYRSERGTDPNGVIDAVNYAARMLSEITEAKVCRDVVDAYRKRIDPQEIKMRPDRAEAILGVNGEDFDQDLLRKKFLRLGIETVAKRGDAIYFRVPTYRSDLTREIDLIEEAIRMIGYNKVGARIGPSVVSEDFTNKRFDISLKKLMERLLARGFSEAVNYAFLSKEFQDHFLSKEDANNAIAVLNPLSERYGVMRMSLIPGLIKNLIHNQRNQEKTVQLFEFGTVFLGKRDALKMPDPASLQGTLNQDSYSNEKPMLAAVSFGLIPYCAFDERASAIDFYDFKGVVSELLQGVGFSDQFPNANVSYEPDAKMPYLHPGESVAIMYQAYRLGSFGKLHPRIASTLEIPHNVFAVELDLKAISENFLVEKLYRPFSRYPTIERDVAFIVDESIEVSSILEAMASVNNAKEQLASLKVFDIFRGGNVAIGKKSVAISLCLRRDDRTLTDEEADEFMSNAIAHVNKITGATLR